MKTLFGSLLIMVLVAACAKYSTGPAVGQIVFKLDPVTCVDSSLIDLFIDADSLGRFSFGPGTQRPFTVLAGNHTTRANAVPAGGLVWPTQNAPVTANAAHVALLAC